MSLLSQRRPNACPQTLADAEWLIGVLGARNPDVIRAYLSRLEAGRLITREQFRDLLAKLPAR